MEAILKDPAYDHVNFDISWDELAKYLDYTPETAKRVADVISRYPDRFLFGTDEVAPVDRAKYTRIFDLYAHLWELLDRRVTEKLRKGNFERLFDQARRRVRAWERRQGLHANGHAPALPRGAVLAANDNMLRGSRAAHRR